MMNNLKQPTHYGFWMPGEFEPHKSCWMVWPQRGDTYRLKAGPAQKAFVEITRAILEFEPLNVCISKEQFEYAKGKLPRQVNLVEMESDDAWVRDTGPSFIVNKHREVRGVNWEFNAWGGIFSPFDKDAALAGNILTHEQIHQYNAPLILEGGSFHVDGQGTLITTEECLLNPNRNPDLSREDIESYLKAYLGVKKIIWIKKGVFMDETEGHVDNLCAFARPGEVVITWTDDQTDPQFEISTQAYEILSRAIDAQGRKLKIHKIHQPGPLFISKEESFGFDKVDDAKLRKEGDRLAGSYVNFYMANFGIVMPLFDDPKDLVAMDAIQKIFPERKIIGVHTREILLGGGNIHCMTQQQPLSA
ncbi:MAG: agmatine deiminase [Desulfobacula sp.]|uniref:agmatine deiminase n=1 Tax=Desulfobacula sp. TaxID=2593537 RepID=UPI001DEA2077|nr:agmatine deiminase [Desulfobacula sp.]MBT7712640.1 agmatine deiminase [Deltaproteobacteria bacterium]MBT3803283.1 agmatine deiminase [Desulfobacula sp.]MBT4027565.1 agmatine deiminase [Desulfobacula sp.]MBT4201228.1 agmatine deiminase [Desulfobacula sp.]